VYSSDRRYEVYIFIQNAYMKLDPYVVRDTIIENFELMCTWIIAIVNRQIYGAYGSSSQLEDHQIGRIFFKENSPEHSVSIISVSLHSVVWRQNKCTQNSINVVQNVEKFSGVFLYRGK